METPFSAYQGDEPYIFVCYAHDDEAIVYPEVDWLHDQGINIWYDEGISGGRIWREAIGDAIKGAFTVLYYISESSLASDHCNREINFTLDQHKKVLPVYLEEVALTTDLEVGLSRVQALHREQDGSYQQHLLKALGASTELSDAAVASVGVRTVSEGDIPTIAVLPLENRSTDSEQDHLGESLSNELWDRLAVVKQLQMISMRSSRLYQNAPQDIREIARLLTADYVIDGSVRLSGSEVHVSLNLIAAKTGRSVWSERFVRPTESTEELFGFYDELADEVAQALNIVSGRPRETTKPEISLAAYNLVQQAKFGGRPFREAVSLADSAIELEPEYALAHATKADALANCAEFGRVVPVEGFEKARQAAQRSIELDPYLPLAYSILGFVHARLDFDFHEAFTAYNRAEELGATPGELAWKQDTLLEAGFYEEGLALSEQWEVTDPVNGAARHFSARFLHRLGRIEEAREKFEEGLSLSPTNYMVFNQTIAFYRDNLGDLTRAKAIIETLPERHQQQEYAYLALANGDPQPLRDQVEEWVAQRSNRFVSAHRICAAYYALADFQRYIEWFEVKVEKRENPNRILDMLNFQHPDYWERLNEWAASDTSHVRERLALIAAHRTLIEQTTRKMLL